MLALYHYSTESFKELQCLQYQKEGKVSAFSKEVLQLKEIPEYDRNISFFFEPLPLDILPALHQFQHPFYKVGKTVVEHTVLLDPDLGKHKCIYVVVESPEVVALRDLFDKKYPGWYNKGDDDPTVVEYFRQKDKTLKDNNYHGDNLNTLTAVSRKFIGTTRKAFKDCVKRKDYEDNKTKYAPNVPHLMLYPHAGKLPVTFTSKRVMG